MGQDFFNIQYRKGVHINLISKSKKSGPFLYSAGILLKKDKTFLTYGRLRSRVGFLHESILALRLTRVFDKVYRLFTVIFLSNLQIYVGTD